MLCSCLFCFTGLLQRGGAVCTANTQHRQAHTLLNMQRPTTTATRTRQRKQRQTLLQLLQVCLTLFVYRTVKSPTKQEKENKSGAPQVAVSSVGCCRNGLTTNHPSINPVGWTKQTDLFFWAGWWLKGQFNQISKLHILTHGWKENIVVLKQ